MAKALAKHDYQDVKVRFDSTGFSHRMADCALCSMARFLGDLDTASEFLTKASPSLADPNGVLDPDGPLPYSEGFKLAFLKERPDCWAAQMAPKFN